MATAEEYFTHLLQTYGSFKQGSEVGPRREVAAKVIEFLDAERAFVDFTPAEVEADTGMDYAPTAAEIQAFVDQRETEDV